MVDQVMQAIWPSWSWAVRPTIGLRAHREVLERMRRSSRILPQAENGGGTTELAGRW
jgi:hypothetical protein